MGKRNHEGRDPRRSKVDPTGRHTFKLPRADLRGGKEKAPAGRREGDREVFNWGVFSWAFGGLLLLLFYPPFFRGLFFPVEQRWSLILATGLFVLTWYEKFSRKDLTFWGHPLEYAALSLVIVYIISGISHPASRSLALAEISKVILYFLIFWMVIQLNTSRARTTGVLHSLYLSGVGVALAGLLAATGIIYIKDGFVGGRFYSTLQYPNALAAYMMGAGFLGFYLWAQSPNRLRFLYAAGNFLLLMVFLGTGSRGAYLVFPTALLFYLLLAPPGFRLNTFAHFLAVVAAAVVADYGFLPRAVARDYAGAWEWFFLGLAVALGLQALLVGIGRMLPSPKLRAVAALGMIILLAAGGYVFTSTRTAPAAVLPEQILHRLQDINLETRSSRERVEWTRDALSMLRERPLLGYGGGGWEAAYRQYQRYFYSSTQVHNYYAQLAVETGIIGIAVMVALWLSFFSSMGKAYRGTAGKERLLVVALSSAALSLGLHAAIDFDLALGAVSILLWSCWGLVRSLERQQNPVNKPALPPAKFAALKVKYASAVGLAVIVILLFSFSFLAGNASAQEGVAAWKAGNTSLAVAKLEEACKYDPFTASYAADLASLYLRQGRTEEALKLALQAQSLEPYNYLLKLRLGEVYWGRGQIREAIAALEEARKLAPWAAVTWEALARAYVAGGIEYLQSNQPTEARELFAAAVQLGPEIEERLSSLGDLKPLHGEKSGGLDFTPALRLELAKAQYFLGQWREAAANLDKIVKDKQLGAEATMWRSLVAERQGQKQLAEQLQGELVKNNPELGEQLRQLEALPVLP
ncbi:MAG: tetratricopeptide repeat protein [Moorellaceae bacterium]